MSRFTFLFCICFIQHTLFAQQKWRDTTEYQQGIHPKRLVFSLGGIGTVWAGSTVGLWNVWYADQSTGIFHFFNDATDWLMADKVGHFYTTYQLCKHSKNAVLWAGLPVKKSVFIGTAIGLGFQTTLEIMDGFSSGWGFSWADMSSNSVGALLFCGQEFLWNEQRLLPKFSYHPTGYAAIRPEVLGYSPIERLLKDYNGQTYWISLSPGKFLTTSTFPKWLCISVGYSIDAKLVGDQNTFTDYSVTNSPTYNARQQWLLSLDVDFNALPVKRKWLKSLLEPLNMLKIPFPTLILSNGKVNGNWFYF